MPSHARGAARPTLSPAQDTPRSRVLATLVWFCGVVLLAFAVRWAFISQARPVVFFEHPVVDARAYWNWAGRIAAGDWLGSGVFYQAPLYPYSLAVIRRFVTEDAMGVRLIQAALGSIGCGLLCLAGCRFASRREGIVAGAMLAVFAPAVFFDGLIQKAVLDEFLMSALLLALAGMGNQPASKRWCTLGIILGLLALTRENALLLIPVLLAWMVLRHRTAPRRTIALSLGFFVAGLALPLGPVMVRNAVVGGEWALTTSQAGSNYYIGNNPSASGIYEPLRANRSDTPQEREDATRLAETATGRSLSPREVSRYWFGRSWSFIRNEPITWAALQGRKFLLLINAHEVPDAEDVYFYAESSSILQALLPVGHYGVLVPLSVAGMMLSWRRIREIRVVHLVVAALSLAIVAFFVFARYRHVLAPPLVLFAAIGIVQAVRSLRLGERRSILAATALAAIFAVPCNWRLFDKKSHLATSYSNAGAALSRAGKLPEAIDYFRRALQLNPADPGVHANLGVALGRMGRIDEAIAALKEADRLQPSDADTLRKLGIAFGERGEWPTAAEYLKRSVSVDPASIQSVTNLATALQVIGRDRESIEVLRAGIRSQRSKSPLSALLAWQLSTHPDDTLRNGAEALALVENSASADSHATLEEIEALAAACAEIGRFNDAVTHQQRAIKLATGMQNIAQSDLQRRLQAYQAGHPWREPH